ncbi:MAG TPA: hypothetical protein DD429_03975 [Clostridiaceae bacterium]|nr:hypothetical protein [Clostridiaceae bacterium]
MKKIAFVLVIALLILSGCGSAVKKIVPNPKPIQEGTDVSKNNANTSSNSKSKNEALSGAETVTANGKATLKNPDSILVLVNKTRFLPSDYAPDDLVKPNVSFPYDGDYPKMYLRKEAAEALEDLFNEAQKDGIKLYAVSGYRSYNTQLANYNNEVKKYGEEAAKQTVALPGQSEHETGLAMDVSAASADYILKESFGNTKEGIWLKEHAKDAGFILRYPEDKTEITGYAYEPWHIRYVGKEAAEYIMSHDITLEEYCED